MLFLRKITGIVKRKGGQGHTSTCLIHPKCVTFPDLIPDRFTRDRGGEEFPVRLRIQMSAVEGEAIALSNRMVPVALHLVYALGDEAGAIVFFFVVLVMVVFV